MSRGRPTGLRIHFEAKSPCPSSTLRCSPNYLSVCHSLVPARVACPQPLGRARPNEFKALLQYQERGFKITVRNCRKKDSHGQHGPVGDYHL